MRPNIPHQYGCFLEPLQNYVCWSLTDQNCGPCRWCCWDLVPGLMMLLSAMQKLQDCVHLWLPLQEWSPECDFSSTHLKQHTSHLQLQRVSLCFIRASCAVASRPRFCTSPIPSMSIVFANIQSFTQHSLLMSTAPKYFSNAWCQSSSFPFSCGTTSWNASLSGCKIDS